MSRKSPNTWKLKTILLNNPWSMNKSKWNEKLFELNKNENVTYQNLQVSLKEKIFGTKYPKEKR